MTSKTRVSKIKDTLSRIIREEYKKVKALKEAGPNDFHEQDTLFAGITFDDLIVAVQSNEQNITPQTVTKVFNEMYKANLQDALYDLKANMNNIIKKAI